MLGAPGLWQDKWLKECGPLVKQASADSPRLRELDRHNEGRLG